MRTEYIINCNFAGWWQLCIITYTCNMSFPLKHNLSTRYSVCLIAILYFNLKQNSKTRKTHSWADIVYFLERYLRLLWETQCFYRLYVTLINLCFTFEEGVSQVTSKNRGILYTRENKAINITAIFARPYVQIFDDLKLKELKYSQCVLSG